MRKRNVLGITGAAVLALAGLLMAGGGFILQTGNPEASAEARKMNAVVTVRAAGCVDPATVSVTATAIGLVNGERRSILLKVARLDESGLFGIAQQWPREGRWVIQLIGHSGSAATNMLLSAGPEGVDRHSAKAEMREFTAGEVEAMLTK